MNDLEVSRGQYVYFVVVERKVTMEFLGSVEREVPYIVCTPRHLRNTAAEPVEL